MNNALFTAPDEYPITQVETRDGRVYKMSNKYIEALQVGADYRLYVPLYFCGSDAVAFPLMAVNELPVGAEIVRVAP